MPAIKVKPSYDFGIKVPVKRKPVGRWYCIDKLLEEK